MSINKPKILFDAYFVLSLESSWLIRRLTCSARKNGGENREAYYFFSTLLLILMQEKFVVASDLLPRFTCLWNGSIPIYW